MKRYDFTRSATEDMLGIWLYSKQQFGEAQANAYQHNLHACCARIAAGNAHVKAVPAVAGAKVHRCHRHHIFFTDGGDAILVLGVFHDRMDTMARLQSRL